MPKRPGLARLKHLNESECRDLGIGLKECAARLGKLHRNAQGVVAVMVDRDQPCDMFGNIQEPLVVGHVHWSIVPRINPDPFPAVCWPTPT